MKGNWIRPLAITASLAAHALLFVQLTGLSQPQATPSEHVRMAEIRLAVAMPAPTEPAPEQEITPPAPAPEKPRQAPRKPTPKSVAEPEAVQPQPEAQPAPPPLVAAASLPDEAMLDDLRRSYIAKVMALIEAHKFYPNAARRRRIEGDVHMQLAIDADGRPCHVECNGSADILLRAARDSLDATPLPAPPPGLELPLSLDFVIQYRLG